MADAAPVTQNTASTTTPATTPSVTSTEAARMLKLKIDGQDMELPESEVISRAQKASAAEKRFQEASTTRKQAEEIIKFAKENPTEFFKKTGMNAREWAENYLMEEIKREQMSPEQRKALENEQKLKQYEAQEKAIREKAHTEKMQALEREQMQNYDTMFVKALSESGLPKTPYTVKRMAELMLVNVKKGLDLGADQLAKIVREDYIAEQKSMYESLEGDKLLEFLGKDVVKKLSRAQLAQYKASAKNNAKPIEREEKPRTTKMDSWKAFKKGTRSLL